MSKKYSNNTYYNLDKVQNKIKHEDSKLCYEILKAIYKIRFDKRASKILGNEKYKTSKSI